MTSEFLNKKILITGASNGIGKSVATYFLNSGATVVLVGKDTESLKTLSKNFPNYSTTITCDLTKDIEIYDLKSSTIERLGSIDYLINCAGIKYDSDIEKSFPQDFDYTMDVNLRNVFILIKVWINFIIKTQ
jgi:short-subunit dehydrogenase